MKLSWAWARLAVEPFSSITGVLLHVAIGVVSYGKVVRGVRRYGVHDKELEVGSEGRIEHYPED